MVGGGIGAFIGAVHRQAAWLDGQIKLVAGAFSSSPEKSAESGKALGMAPHRTYASYQEMVEKEAALPPEERIDFVSIVTPNSSHASIATAFLKKGFPVICDKPMTFDLQEALSLRETVKQSGLVFCLTHNYTGYPMVKEAREWVKQGKLGNILKIVAEYPQGWLMNPIEQEGQKQASWRTDPSKAGASCCLGDIGTHAENLARYITGLDMEAICADFTTFVPGRPLEDDANLLVRYRGGAKGVLYASQISAGEENNLSIRIYGTKASLEWRQEDPNDLWIKFPDKPSLRLRRGNDYLSEAAKANTRLPFGHPEAFIEAFANIYKEAARAIADQIKGKEDPHGYDFPDVEDGVEGMLFIDTAVKASRSESKWTTVPRL